MNATDVPEVIRELQEKVALSWSSNNAKKTPAQIAAEKGHVRCFELLASIGGANPFRSMLAENPAMIDQSYRWMLSKPELLDLPTKRAWLHSRLEAKVGHPNAAKLSLVSRRDNILDGLCDALGIDEETGKLKQGTRAQRLDVRYEDEGKTRCGASGSGSC